MITSIGPAEEQGSLSMNGELLRTRPYRGTSCWQLLAAGKETHSPLRVWLLIGFPCSSGWPHLCTYKEHGLDAGSGLEEEKEEEGEEIGRRRGWLEFQLSSRCEVGVNMTIFHCVHIWNSLRII